LPVNFVVLNWIENKPQSTVPMKKDIKCEDCEEKSATFWCERCSVYYCSDCSSIVHSRRATRDHLCLTLKEKSKRTIFVKCKRHLEENKFYCVDCQVLLCSMCVIDDHKLHNAMSVFKYTDGLREELKFCVAPLQNNEPLEKIEREVKQDTQNNEKELESLKDKIRIVEELIRQNHVDIRKVNERQEKVKTSHIVFLKLIEDMGVMDLMDKENIEGMKRKIMEVIEQVYPEAVPRGRSRGRARILYPEEEPQFYPEEEPQFYPEDEFYPPEEDPEFYPPEEQPEFYLEEDLYA